MQSDSTQLALIAESADMTRANTASIVDMLSRLPEAIREALAPLLCREEAPRPGVLADGGFVGHEAPAAPPAASEDASDGWRRLFLDRERIASALGFSAHRLRSECAFGRDERNAWTEWKEAELLGKPEARALRDAYADARHAYDAARKHVDEAGDLTDIPPAPPALPESVCALLDAASEVRASPEHSGRERMAVQSLRDAARACDPVALALVRGEAPSAPDATATADADSALADARERVRHDCERLRKLATWRNDPGDVTPGGFDPHASASDIALVCSTPSDVGAANRARMRYQTLVYDVCNVLDRYHGRSPGRGVTVPRLLDDLRDTLRLRRGRTGDLAAVCGEAKP